MPQAWEDSIGKHPVTPGEVLPAKELLADMLLQLDENLNALQAYEAVLNKCPNRFNSLYGAAKAAEKCSKQQKDIYYYKQLLSIVDTGGCNRQEITEARKFLAKA